MPTYRYYTTDILTGSILGELELYGVYCTRQLSRAGQFTGTIRLTSDSLANSIAIDATHPGRTAMYIERDGVLVWNGPIWSRTYSDMSNAVQLTGQTFESYFDHIVFEEHFIQQKIAQEQIFLNMVNQLQTQIGCNIGLSVATLPVSNVPRTVLVPGYEYHFATDALTQLIGVDGGLEYTIDAAAGSKVIRLGYPELGAANASLAFDFPGNIAHYWLPESGASAGIKFAVLGAGQGNKVLRAVAIDQNALNAGYPGWWNVNKYSNLGDLTTVQSKVTANANKFKMPLIRPTFELGSTHTFTSWNNLGDVFKAHLEDVRFPGGYDILSRMIGWELTPAAANSPEILKLVVEGADAG